MSDRDDRLRGKPSSVLRGHCMQPWAELLTGALPYHHGGVRGLRAGVLQRGDLQCRAALRGGVYDLDDLRVGEPDVLFGHLPRGSLLLGRSVSRVRYDQRDVLPGECLHRGKLLLGGAVSRVRYDQHHVLSGERVPRGSLLFGRAVSRVRYDQRDVLSGERVCLGEFLLRGAMPRVRYRQPDVLPRERVPRWELLLGEPLSRLRSQRTAVL